MTTRPLKDSDIPALRAMYEKSGLTYDWPPLKGPLMEEVLVLVDDEDKPLMAAAAERMIQGYLFIDDSLHPAAQLRGIRMLHEGLVVPLRQKGYSELNCAIPPKMEKTFGRRLMKNFGWVRSWATFARQF